MNTVSETATSTPAGSKKSMCFKTADVAGLRIFTAKPETQLIRRSSCCTAFRRLRTHSTISFPSGGSVSCHRARLSRHGV